MHPILFHVGSFPVRMYSLAIITAFFSGTIFCVWLARRRGLPWAEQYADFLTWALVGGIVGSRVWDVAFNWSYYGARPAEILAIWEGGSRSRAASWAASCWGCSSAASTGFRRSGSPTT